MSKKAVDVLKAKDWMFIVDHGKEGCESFDGDEEFVREKYAEKLSEYPPDKLFMGRIVRSKIGSQKVIDKMPKTRPVDARWMCVCRTQPDWWPMVWWGDLRRIRRLYSYYSSQDRHEVWQVLIVDSK